MLYKTNMGSLKNQIQLIHEIDQTKQQMHHIETRIVEAPTTYWQARQRLNTYCKPYSVFHSSKFEILLGIGHGYGPLGV